MANGVYNRAKYMLADGTLDLPTAADLRVLLVNTSYVFDPDHNFVSDVVANEISAGGYSRQPLTGETITEDDTNDFAYLHADNVAFGALAAGQTIGGAILFKYNASDSAAEVIAFYDVTDTPTNGGTITLNWAADASGGVLKLA